MMSIVCSQISAVFIISSSLGAKVFPVLVGQLVEAAPMTLHYLTLGIATGCAFAQGCLQQPTSLPDLSNELNFMV